MVGAQATTIGEREPWRYGKGAAMACDAQPCYQLSAAPNPFLMRAVAVRAADSSGLTGPPCERRPDARRPVFRLIPGRKSAVNDCCRTSAATYQPPSASRPLGRLANRPPLGGPSFAAEGILAAMKDNLPGDADEAIQWLMTLFLGPVAAVLAAIVVGLLLRGTGLR